MSYHDSNVQTNLYTSGGEFVCDTNSFQGCGEGTNNTYIGYYHIHPEKGAMAGAEHSNQSHPLLTTVANRRKKMPNRKRNVRRPSRRRARQMSCPPGQIMSDGQCVPAGNGRGGYRKSTSRKAPRRVKRTTVRGTSNRKSRILNRAATRRRVATKANSRSSINRQRNIRRRAKQAGNNPIYSGNVLYHCPPGITTITSDCVAQRRK